MTQPRTPALAAALPPDLAARPPAPGDALAIRGLVAACDRTCADWAPAGWTVPEVPPDLPARLAAPGHWSLAAFDPAGAIVALAEFRRAYADEMPGLTAGSPLPGVAHLAALYVHPSRWRQGIAAALLARAEAAMRSRDCATARLWTPSGAPAERFYAAQGWRRDERAGWHPWLGLQMVGYAKRL